MISLALYYTDSCPYCVRVFQFIREKKIVGLEYKNILELPENREALIDVGGKAQVPCLLIDGRPLYESDDIIKWLSKNKR